MSWNPVLARAMDRILILHADHEQNASTSTVRLAGSSGANPFACIAAGIASLWGPAHGGANEAVLKMLMEIGHKDRIPEFVARAEGQERQFQADGLRASRLQELRSPRVDHAPHLPRGPRRTRHQERSLAGPRDRARDGRIADEYFIEKKLYPNVDFYSGIILKAMGFPMATFTVLFAIARTVGWVAQWNEMIGDPVQKIGRPRQLYTGEPSRNYISIENRDKPSTAT